MLSKKNVLIFIIFIIVVIALQFFIARKHIYYGFNNDDWLLLAWYKQVVNNPLLDIAKAWKEIGAHDFARAYHMGILFNFFGFSYQYYHFVNTLLKALAGLSFFPVIYLLFKKRSLAYLATFLFSVHFSSFGALHDVFIGDQSLVVVSMNIFLALYLWVAQRHNFNLKIMLIILMLLLAAAFFDIPRFYPFLVLLPFLELFNFWLNRSSTTLKGSLLRLIFLYSPFIALALYFPPAVSEFSLGKPIEIIKTENFQLFIAPFAFFGSTFVPDGIIDQLSHFSRVGNNVLYQDFWIFFNFLIFRFLVLAFPLLFIMSSLVFRKYSKRFVLTSLFLSICFLLFAFFAANHWIYLDPKIKAGVDPGLYFIPGVIGLFVFSTAISFFIEWLRKRDNYFLLTLSLAPIFSLLYIFFTWLIVGENFIFMGVHNYLSIPALGSSMYLSIIFYLAFENLRLNIGAIRKMTAILTVIYFFLFLIFSSIQVDKYYANWLKLGYAASDQTRIQNSFWKEVGRGESIDKSPILVYLDTSADDGYYYGANFTWDIPSLLTVEKGLPFERGFHCKSVISSNDIDKLRIEEVDGKKMIAREACGPDRFYELENFYAFKFINLQLVPIKSEIIKNLVDKAINE